MIPRKSAFERLTRREYALMACGCGALVLAFLPLLLHYHGTRWKPGVHATGRTATRRQRQRGHQVSALHPQASPSAALQRI